MHLDTGFLFMWVLVRAAGDGGWLLVLVLAWALAMAFGTCCPACQHAPPSPWRRTALGVGGRRDPWLEPECTCGVGGGLGGGVGLL